MADQREVFTILESITTAAGVRLPARAEGDSASDNHVPSMVAKDSSGNYKLIEARDKGEAEAGINALPVLGALDESSNLEYIQLRAEGSTVAGLEVPVLPAKDSSGNWAHIPINSDGEIPVSIESGTPKHGYAKVTSTALNTFDEIVAVTLTASKNYESLDMSFASTFTTVWQVLNVDDAEGTPVETILFETITGPGCFHFSEELEKIQFATGSTGVQELQVKASQLHGALTDKRAYVGSVERP